MEQLSEVLPANTGTCVHHWMLGAPVAGITNGLCRECGAIREFTDSRPAQPYFRRGRRS